MDGDRRLDEVLDAYEEAFENLPVYQRSNYMKMNDVDRLARDVAFEIILGGDRFEPSDVAAHLDGISRPEMGLFKKRVEYHTVDFAPEEMRTPDFVGRMVEGWTQGVRLSDGAGIREAFSAAYNRQERGLWFRFDDGSVRRCDRAVTDAMWNGEELARMDPKPLSAAEAAVGERRAALDEARAFKGKLEVAATEASMRRQNVYEHLSQEYGLDAQAVLREPDPDWGKGKEPPPPETLEARVNELNAQIAALGPLNMAAIDDFRELEERYTREKEQEADLLAAREKILELITNLNSKSSEMFRTTFEQANENFQRMFTKLFNGGEARLVLLENAEDPLECGIDIIARPPGKRPQSVTLLSGGERTMTAVALLFAIFMIKPAPFCMLDELDAALDDANIGRFVEALKDFLDRSQFLIITHNQHTIAGSDLVYGVSQQEKGISRIISMRLADIGVKPMPDEKA